MPPDAADLTLPFLPAQNDQCLPPEVRASPLQGSRTVQGRVCVPGPLCLQVPGHPRADGQEADRVVYAG